MPQSTRFEKAPEAHQSTLNAVQHGGSLSPSHTPLPTLGLAQSNWDNLIGLVVRSYIPENELPFIWDNSDNSRSRICGFWVEVLPELTAQTHQDCILPSAMKALATSILASTPHQSPSSLDSTKHYYAAIRALRIEIAARNPVSHAEFAASIMCLSLTEVFSFYHKFISRTPAHGL